ncbi:MAG: hypothetical protein V3S26_08225 [Acidimicrobiia bacterium]
MSSQAVWQVLVGLVAEDQDAFEWETQATTGVNGIELTHCIVKAVHRDFPPTRLMPVGVHHAEGQEPRINQ